MRDNTNNKDSKGLAFKFGYQAFCANETVQDNPYKCRMLAEEWLKGWLEAQKDFS